MNKNRIGVLLCLSGDKGAYILLVALMFAVASVVAVCVEIGGLVAKRSLRGA